LQKIASFEDRGHFIYCKYKGPFALVPLTDLTKEVDDYCKSNECDAVLVDISKSSGDMDDFKIFEHGKATSRLMRSKVKLAVFGRKDQRRGKFWEDVTRNRLMKAKVFTKKQNAIKWLRSNSVL
jgi:hypothetical protein